VAIKDKVYQMVLSRLKVDALPGWRMVLMVDVSHFKRLNENMTMFLQTVSHDLRSPLTAAKGFVDMLPMVGEINERQVMMLDKVTTSIVDMTNLVEKVLDAGRLDPEMGAYEIRREMCDPAEIIEKVASSLAPAASKKNLILEAEAGQGVPVMNLDTMMIERSLTNLVENAIKYTPEGGTVWVRVSAENHRLTFSVEDNGFGIPSDKLPSLFERGSRVRREEHKAIRGSGLGLFIVKNVAQQHGGDATIESVEGQGSIFRIVIPLSGQNTIAGT
jgi:signal transduction histidine kinase